ncbi:hypothetical protein EDI_261080 [Entamoeba dispar SAW760]|uniref:Uncharacterized protein n=1 Tax=Entamoeba dispar (strain ATCC PRA-260 / SAW760) TaxID=370354 RepID=B0E879_ENTDS|nr:uncharacterized protein EDI_261080 [Entamoeba dispar SAW760]EDR29268.1 hypothetical protein EDI_261080 [Entamoeba dispar SAW760]|eukprot:EDR29268.1 hypothetical protein EDI_261080 [Entamoeba dispar SAW760]
MTEAKEVNIQIMNVIDAPTEQQSLNENNQITANHHPENVMLLGENQVEEHQMEPPQPDEQRHSEEHPLEEHHEEEDDKLDLLTSGSLFDDPKTAGFRKTRNYQTEQQSVFIALLSMVYTIVIDHPRKRSKITLPFFNVIRISTEKEVVEIKEIMSTKLQQLHDEDIAHGCSEKTATRRQEVYRVSEQLHILMNLLRDVGFEIESKKTTGNKGNQKETARKIKYNNFTFDKEFIEERGNLINELLIKRLESIPKSSDLSIECGDSEIANILKMGSLKN